MQSRSLQLLHGGKGKSSADINSVAEYCCLPSGVQIQSYKPDWLSTKQNYAADFRMSPSHRNTMASNAGQYPSSKLTAAVSCEQDAIYIRQPSRLASSCWCCQSPISVTAFTTSYMVRCVTCRQEHTVERRLAISFSNQLCDSSEPHLTAARLWPTSLFMVNVELFPHRPGHMQSFHVEVGLIKSPNWSRVDSQNPGPYWGLLSTDQVWRWSDNSAWIWTWWNQQVKFYGNYSTCRTKSQQQLTLTVKTKKKTAK